MNTSGKLSCDNLDKKDCEICSQANMTKKLFWKVERFTQVLKMVHSDIYDLNGIVTRGRNHILLHLTMITLDIIMFTLWNEKIELLMCLSYIRL